MPRITLIPLRTTNSVVVSIFTVIRKISLLLIVLLVENILHRSLSLEKLLNTLLISISCKLSSLFLKKTMQKSLDISIDCFNPLTTNVPSHIENHSIDLQCVKALNNLGMFPFHCRKSFSWSVFFPSRNFLD